MTLVSISGFSQETKAVFFTHDLGKFYLYINNQLVDRAPQNQLEFITSSTTDLIVKIVFQDHNLIPIEKEISLKKNKLSLFVIYLEKEVTKFDNYQKIKIGKYRPGFVLQEHNSMPNYDGRLGCDSPCNFSITELAVQQMKRETTNMAQFTIARDLVLNNCITVSDLKLVLNSFINEANKVEFAKFAWAYIFDQENYYHLKSLFDHPQTFTEINKFVESNQ
jgi:hypothetical protein